jgi:hypothetical protein
MGVGDESFGRHVISNVSDGSYPSVRAMLVRRCPDIAKVVEAPA